MTIDNAIDLMNDALKCDGVAISQLAFTRVPCNQALAQHPSIQVSGESTVGLLGILNGLFGIDSRGRGYIEAYVYDGQIVRFQRTTS